MSVTASVSRPSHMHHLRIADYHSNLKSHHRPTILLHAIKRITLHLITTITN